MAKPALEVVPPACIHSDGHKFPPLKDPVVTMGPVGTTTS